MLVDDPLWWWRGRRWCHLVSDVSLDELHRFAAAAGVSRRAFQGDHYDIPEEHREQLIAAGAVAVPSRELLRRLRAAGLRLAPAERRARRRAAGGDGVAIEHRDGGKDGADDQGDESGQGDRADHGARPGSP